jgi:hypothetical protein
MDRDNRLEHNTQLVIIIIIIIIIIINCTT